MTLKLMLIMAACLALAVAGHAEDKADEPDSPWLFDVEFDWIGLGLNVGFRGAKIWSGVDTIFRAIIGATYDFYGYFRTSADEPFCGIGDEKNFFFNRFYTRFSLEFDQGILWSERDKQNRLEFFLAYKFRYEKNCQDTSRNQTLFDSALPDKDQLLQNSFLIGLEWKDVDHKHPHRLLSGTAAELSFEWGPQVLLNDLIGRADFYRFNFSARAFLPLFDVEPQAELNLFSGYLGFFVALDYARGTSIPLFVRETLGGKYARKGLGYAVRGLEECRFDTPFKAVANLDLRINLPAIIHPSVIPGIVLYFDCGYYHYIDHPESGLVLGTGAGLYLSLFDMVNLCFYTQFLLTETKVSGALWTPLYFAFIFHF